MAPSLIQVGIAAIMGAVDNVLSELEEQGKITGNATYVKDIIRIGGGFGGLAVSYLFARPGTLLDDVTSAMGLSMLPLALHSVRKLAKGAFTYAFGGSRRTYTVVRRTPPVVSQPVGAVATPPPAPSSSISLRSL